MLIKGVFRSKLLKGLVRNYSAVTGLNNEVHSPFEDVKLSELPYFDYVYEKVEARQNMTAVVDGLTGQSWTYQELRDKSRLFGSSLKNLPGCYTLGIFLPNCIEYPVIFSGAAYANVTTTTMNPIYTPRELVNQLRLAKASYVVTTSAQLPTLEKTSRIMNRRVQPILTDKKVDGCLSLGDMLEETELQEGEEINVHDEVITLPFSSGTTGTPKGVMLTHFNLVANMCQGLDTHPAQALFEESTEDNQSVLLCILPLYHIYAMNVAMGPALRSGAKLVMLSKFEPASFLNALVTHRPTNLQLAPPLVSFLVTSPQVKGHHMESVKDIMVGAAPLGPALIEQFKAKFPGIVLREAWGMSEISPIGLMTPRNDIRTGSCGVAVPNTRFKIVDVGTGENLKVGQVGELCCTGPMVMKGYINNKKATSSTIQGDWLHTGDVAYYDEDGYIYIVDRIKELIKVKGYQVPPAEIEDLLRKMDGVKDVAVIGIPHEKFGEVPRAYVVKDEGNTDLTEEDVITSVAKNVASYKQLTGGVEFIEEIPKSAAGKILRRVLTDKFKAKDSVYTQQYAKS